MLFGAHCSGGIKKALAKGADMGAEAVQLFVQSPRTWRFPEHDPADLAAFRERRQELEIGGVLVHALYLVNLASPNDDFYAKSVSTLRSTVDAASAIEAAVCALAVATGRIPPTINLDDPDPECDLDYVPHAARACPVTVAVNNAYGFGGCNSSLVLRACGA